MSINDFTNRFNKTNVTGEVTTGNTNSPKTSKFSKPNFSNLSTKFKNMNRTHLYIGGFLIAIVLVFLAGRYFAPVSTLGAPSTGQVNAPTPIATQQLNKTFEFPLLDENGKEVSKISYTLQNANLQNAFIYQGKLATAVKGRVFLIFDLKIKNPYTKTIEINAKDYIRIKLNNSDELLAPEIHNDPVQIQANSTKYTRIGLPINDTDKNITLFIGELQGKKETVKLNLEK